MLKDVFIGNGLPGQKEAITSVLFGGSWLLLSVILFLHAMLRPKMGILGRKFYYKKEWYSCDQIWEIRITRLSRIILYMEGKRFASYSWDESNAEKLIAWARKCGVSVRDDRNPIGNHGGEDVFFLRDLFTKDLFGKTIRRSTKAARMYPHRSGVHRRRNSRAKSRTISSEAIPS